MALFNDAFKKSPAQREREMQLETNTKELEDLKASLENFKTTLLKDVKSPNKREEINTSIQLLIFHYLGLLDILKSEINDNNKTALLLSTLFNREGTENIRKKLSNVGGKGSTLLTEKNLNYVKNLFEKIGLPEPLEKVRKDLKKLPASKD